MQVEKYLCKENPIWMKDKKPEDILKQFAKQHYIGDIEALDEEWSSLEKFIESFTDKLFKIEE